MENQPLKTKWVPARGSRRSAPMRSRSILILNADGTQDFSLTERITNPSRPPSIIKSVSPVQMSKILPIPGIGMPPNTNTVMSPQTGINLNRPITSRTLPIAGRAIPPTFSSHKIVQNHTNKTITKMPPPRPKLCRKNYPADHGQKIPALTAQEMQEKYLKISKLSSEEIHEKHLKITSFLEKPLSEEELFQMQDRTIDAILESFHNREATFFETPEDAQKFYTPVLDVEAEMIGEIAKKQSAQVEVTEFEVANEDFIVAEEVVVNTSPPEEMVVASETKNTECSILWEKKPSLLKCLRCKEPNLRDKTKLELNVKTSESKAKVENEKKEEKAQSAADTTITPQQSNLSNQKQKICSKIPTGSAKPIRRDFGPRGVGNDTVKRRYMSLEDLRRKRFMVTYKNKPPVMIECANVEIHNNVKASPAKLQLNNAEKKERDIPAIAEVAANANLKRRGCIQPASVFKIPKIKKDDEEVTYIGTAIVNKSSSNQKGSMNTKQAKDEATIEEKATSSSTSIVSAAASASNGNLPDATLSGIQERPKRSLVLKMRQIPIEKEKNSGVWKVVDSKESREPEESSHHVHHQPPSSASGKVPFWREEDMNKDSREFISSGGQGQDSNVCNRKTRSGSNKKDGLGYECPNLLKKLEKIKKMNMPEMEVAWEKIFKKLEKLLAIGRPQRFEILDKEEETEQQMFYAAELNLLKNNIG